MATSRRNAAATDPAARADRAGAHLGLVAAKGTNAWLSTQSEVLREMDDATRAFVERRRDAIEASQRSLQALQSCGDLIDAMKVQQRWLTDSLQRIASDMGEFGVSALTLSQRAIAGLWETGRDIGEDTKSGVFALSAAGAKPGRRKRRRT